MFTLFLLVTNPELIKKMFVQVVLHCSWITVIVPGIKLGLVDNRVSRAIVYQKYVNLNNSIVKVD